MTTPLTVRLGEIVRDTITQNRAILLAALESLAAETRTIAEDGLDGMDAVAAMTVCIGGPKRR